MHALSRIHWRDRERGIVKGVPGVEPPTSNLDEPFGSTQRGGFARSTIPARSSSSTSNRITKIRVRVSIAVEIVPQMTIPDALSTPKSGLRETLLLVCEGQTMQYMSGFLIQELSQHFAHSCYWNYSSPDLKLNFLFLKRLFRSFQYEERRSIDKFNVVQKIYSEIIVDNSRDV